MITIAKKDRFRDRVHLRLWLGLGSISSRQQVAARHCTKIMVRSSKIFRQFGSSV